MAKQRTYCKGHTLHPSESYQFSDVDSNSDGKLTKIMTIMIAVTAPPIMPIVLLLLNSFFH